MPNGDEENLAQAKQYLDAQKLSYTETEQQHCTRLGVKKGQMKNYFDVFNTGSIRIGGKSGTVLHGALDELKKSIVEGEPLPGSSLPIEYARWPQVLREKIPDVDDVIMTCFAESLETYRVEALLSSSFMLGAASEKAILLLVDSYANAISDDKKKEKFMSRVNGKVISRKYDEFIRSFKAAKTKPSPDGVGNDIEVVIDQMFQFCRLVRNEVGHPKAVPDIDKGVVLANISHFVGYIERIYKLKSFFEATAIEV